MLVDEAGALWLSDPWIVGLLLIGAVGIVFWCHRWLEDGSAPMPRSVASRVRLRTGRSRKIRHQQAIRPALVTVARSSAESRPSLRLARSNGSPRSAA